MLATIDIILDDVYSHPNLDASIIPRIIFKNLLTICTTKCPFRNHNGDLYLQHDGVSMGSPLGPTFASYYMCHLENRAFAELHVKPAIYCRYVDDCFIGINSIAKLHELKNYFQQNSILTYTYDLETSKNLAFLDVILHRSNVKIVTSTYTKSTNTQECLNYNSLCPTKYKIVVISTLLHRSF